LKRAEDKVIGYLAYKTLREVLCDGDSCIIAGSQSKLREYVKKMYSGGTEMTIQKVRFGEIKRGLDFGGAYSFDEEAYNRFYPLASKAGINVGKEDFSGPTPTGFHFVRVQKLYI
jgi:hypothetical protein